AARRSSVGNQNGSNRATSPPVGGRGRSAGGRVARASPGTPLVPGEGGSMKLRKSLPLLLAALAFAGPASAGNYMSNAWPAKTDGGSGGVHSASEAPELIGPYGTPIQAVAPASYREPTGADYAQYVLSQSMPPQMISQAGYDQYYGHGWQQRDRAASYPNNCGPAGCAPMMPPGPGMMPPGPGGMPLGPGLPPLP